MNTIYWITILDNIREWGVALGIVSLLPLFYSIMLWCNDVDSDKQAAKKILKFVLPCFMLFISITIFVPSTKDAYIIYGVGGTIDYLQQNETAKKLPDKAVKALDCFLDKEINDTTKTK